jgi:hypothetical protein
MCVVPLYDYNMDLYIWFWSIYFNFICKLHENCYMQLWCKRCTTLNYQSSHTCTLLQNTSTFHLHFIKHMQKQKQMTHGSKLINLPFALVTFMCLCLFSRISKWSRLEVSFLNILCVSFSFGDVIIVCGTELRLFLPF